MFPNLQTDAVSNVFQATFDRITKVPTNALPKTITYTYNNH